MAQEIKITQTSNADMNIGVPKNLTAVEWLVDKVTDMIHESNHLELVSLLEQAKQMEIKQNMSNFDRGFNDGYEQGYDEGRASN